jgi:hypothetical protein
VDRRTVIHREMTTTRCNQEFGSDREKVTAEDPAPQETFPAGEVVTFSGA